MVKNKKELYVDVWNIDVDNYIRPNDCNFQYEYDGFFDGNNRTAFEYHRNWYDIYTHEPIEGKIKTLNKIDTIYIDWDVKEPKMVENTYFMIPSTTETIFLYNKPLPVDWNKIFGFWSTKARKYAQKKVNKRDRQRVREYISRKDWDKDVKTHALSKSIAWEIY
jgi:hypothetical protein